MRTPILIAATTALFTLTLGCVPTEKATPDADAFTKHLPDERILVALPSGGNRAIGATADSYVTTVQVSTDVNGWISNVLDMLDTITSFEPTYSDAENRFFWGPWDDGGLDPNHTALYVEFDEPTGKYAWAIVKRDKDSTDDEDWTPIVAGEAYEGDDEDQGHGFFIIDFDANTALSPAESAVGTFLSTYEVTDAGVVAEASFDEFAENGSDDPITAGYSYGQDPTGAGYMDLAYLADINEDGSQEETIVLRTRWLADGAGRGDSVVFGGDLGVLTYTATECWDTDFAVSFEENNAELQRAGDETSCVFDQPEWNEEAPEPS